MPRARHGIAIALGVLLLYVGAVVWLTWPLAVQLGTHAPARLPGLIFDFLHNVWVLTWEARALTTDPSRLADAPIYHPTPHALFYGPTAFGLLPLFVPAWIATGSGLAATNLTLLASMALTAWSAHVVVARWTGSHAAAAVSGAAVLATPTLFATIGAPYLTMLAPLPWIIVLVAARAPSGRAIVALAVLVAVQASIDPMHYMLAVAAPLVLVVAHDLWRPTARAGGVRLSVALVAALVLLSPVYTGYATVAAANPGIASQSVWRHLERAAAAGIAWDVWLEAVRTVPLGPLLGWTWKTWLGLGVVVIGAACARRADPPTRRRWGVVATWIGVGCCGFVLSLPPMRMALVGVFPPVRTIYRVCAAAGIGIALILGLATAAISARFARTRYAEALVTVGLIVALFGPALWRPQVPYTTVAVPAPTGPVLAALQRGTAPLIELPAEGLAPVTVAMYRATFHTRPLLTGYSSYFPAGYTERVALAKRLPDRDALDTLRRATGLDMVLVQLRGLPTPARDAWENLAAVRATGLEYVARSDTELVFRVADTDE